MDIFADLHMHSQYSPDGELTVKELLDICSESGIETISITDHNVVGATADAMDTAAEYKIKVIPGIEIDCNYRSTDLHLLGYQVNWKSADFSRLEKDVATMYMASFSMMVGNLAKIGIPVDPEEVLKKADGRLPSAELIAEVLLGNSRYNDIDALQPYRTGGNRSDMPYINFYLDYFAQGKPAYVKMNFMDYDDAVSLIRRNGGIPVVAHPGHNFRNREEIVVELLQKGALGLEVFNNYHSDDQVKRFADIALKHKVIMTCGSDFHGKTKPLIHPGHFRWFEQYHGYVRQSIEELSC